MSVSDVNGHFVISILMQSFEDQWLAFNPGVHNGPSYSSLEKVRLRLCGSYPDLLDC